MHQRNPFGPLAERPRSIANNGSPALSAAAPDRCRVLHTLRERFACTMDTKRARILAVEDNSETQLLLKHLLKASFDVLVVSGVDDALNAVDDQDFDIFLLDINLSGQRTGTDLLHLLRKRDNGLDVPAIALTAYAMPGDREDFLEAGFDQYVSKPFTRSDLTSAIDKSLHHTGNASST